MYCHVARVARLRGALPESLGRRHLGLAGVNITEVDSALASGSKGDAGARHCQPWFECVLADRPLSCATQTTV
jgi:hypothetical protein